MNFIEKILTSILNFGEFIGDLIQDLFIFLAKPLAYLLEFLEGIFYFITKFFEVVIKFITLFVSLFQYIFAIATGLLRTISNWIGFTPSSNLNLPSASEQGFETALTQIGGTGLLTVVPNVLIAILWIFFAIKIIGLIGDRGGKPA